MNNDKKVIFDDKLIQTFDPLTVHNLMIKKSEKMEKAKQKPKERFKDWASTNEDGSFDL